jgi:hypothetical protein
MTIQVPVHELPTYYQYYREQGIPVLVTGHSGIGKTQVTDLYAHNDVGGYMELRTSQMDPSDIKGIPYLDGGISRWASPDFLPYEDRDGKYGVLCLEEILDGTQEVNASTQSLVLERRVGDYRLPDGWQIIALGNRKEHGGINRGLSVPQKTRYAHIEAIMELGADTQAKDGLLPHFIRSGVDPIVISFLKFHPDMAFKMPETGAAEWAYPNPRAWERVSGVRKKDPSKSMRFNLYASLVGEGAAVAFASHEDVAVDVPDPLDCIKSPDKTRIPENPSAKYAIACSLAQYADQKNFDNVLKYMSRLDPEFTTLCVMQAWKKTKELEDTKAFSTWAIENSDVLLG